MTATPHWRQELREQVAELLTSLGDDPRHVAGRLQAAGVVGTPGNVKDCAIARYLTAVVGADTRIRCVKVTNRSVALTASRSWRPLRVRLPRPLQEFVVGFDHCLHPELIRPAGRGGDTGARMVLH